MVIVEQVYRLKNSEDDTEGLDAKLTVENGQLLLDLSKPVRWLSLNAEDSQRFIAALLTAGFAAFAKQDDGESKSEPAKPN